MCRGDILQVGGALDAEIYIDQNSVSVLPP